MVIGTGIGLGLNALTGIGNATNSYGYSDNSSGESSYAEASSNGWSKVYGSEASAEDILRANEANKLQTAYMIAQMKYNASEAEKARAYETAMSNTAYQRQVKDLIEAGLNPILAVGTSGASTPSVAAATGGLQSAHKANTYANQESYNESNSYSKSSGGSRSHSEQKTNTQLKSLLGSVGSAAKGMMEGITKGINDYSWEGAIRN